MIDGIENLLYGTSTRIKYEYVIETRIVQDDIVIHIPYLTITNIITLQLTQRS